MLPQQLCKVWPTGLRLGFWLLSGMILAPTGLVRAESLPIADSVYLQEVGRLWEWNDPITSLAADQGQIFAGTSKGLLRLESKGLVPVEAVRETVVRLIPAGGFLWVLTPQGIVRGHGEQWVRISTNVVSDLAQFRGGMVASSGRNLWRIQGETLEPWGSVTAPFEILRILPHQESLFVVGANRITTFNRGRFGGLDAYGFPADQTWDWGALPSPEIRDALSLSNRLVLATGRGLGVLRGMSLTSVRGEQGLPFEDTTCLAAGFDDELWIGTTRGAVRQHGKDFDYFAGRRWLPDDHVRAIAVQDRTVCVGTDRGLGVITYQPYTLAKKAAYYERYLEAWGQKRLGLVHKLEWDDTLKEFVREAGDNDGGYSSYYLAAQSYRWAVTHDPEARREATNTFHALRWLEGATGIPGFTARSLWVKGERGHRSSGGSGGYPAEWHDATQPPFEWKGDTSSDELCGQFYALTIFLDRAAEGQEIAQAKTLIARIAGHLVDHHWQLVDLDGKPTRWGRWDPDYFLTDEGRYDRGLQAVELLSFIKTAEVLAGDPKFTAAYRQLVDLGYPEYTLRWRNTFPPDSVLHFLDELAFWSFANLLKYESDPELHALYRRAYERGYEIVRGEHNPWFNFLYGALTQNPFEADAAVNHLREWPLDLRVWSYQNSHRSDLRTPPDYVALKGGTRAFSPRETEPLRWDHWTMQADGGAGGRDVVEPASWLLAYWLGRYHGFLAAPTTRDPALLECSSAEVPSGGARRYDGPSRPAGF